MKSFLSQPRIAVSTNMLDKNKQHGICFVLLIFVRLTAIERLMLGFCVGFLFLKKRGDEK
jgi:hypothetical protein